MIHIYSNKHYIKCIVSFFCYITIESCSEGERKDFQRNQIIDTIVKTELPVVDYTVIKAQKFQEEVISNGKLQAVEKADLSFNRSGILKTLKVFQGSTVRKGDILASLENEVLKQNLNKANVVLEEAELDYKDMIVSRGYQLDSLALIPKNILDMIAVRSGRDKALYDKNIAALDLESSYLIAPFSGKIANIEYHQFDQVSSNKKILSIVNEQAMVAQLVLIESELHKVSISDSVKLYTVGSDTPHYGKIVRMNPMVDESGAITLEALVDNDGSLLDGMNFKAVIVKSIPNQFIVPKSAVIFRQNTPVIFKLVSGKSYWTYIKITHENEFSYTVLPDPNKTTSKLTIGDTILTSENLSLSHGKPVKLRNTLTND